VIAAESEFLVEELRLPVRPWQSRLADFPGVWEALEAVGLSKRFGGSVGARRLISSGSSLRTARAVMTVDYRKLLKDCIRGQRWDWIFRPCRAPSMSTALRNRAVKS
jgi:hypothetical protein